VARPRVEKVAIRVRLFGFLPVTADREVLRSVYGPVLRLPHGSFAIRWAGMGEVRQVEQWYRMNRASTFDAWRDAMRMQAIPSLNAAYADRSGRIAYFYNARIPFARPATTGRRRTRQYQPHVVDRVPPFDAMPKVVNPPSGFVQNCNSSPFETTLGAGNPRPEDFPESAGIETRMTNRSLRALEQLGADSSLTDEELRAIKFDVTVSEKSELFEYLETRTRGGRCSGRGAAIARSERCHVAAFVDRRADSGNRATTLAILTLYPLIQARHDGRPNPTRGRA